MCRIIRKGLSIILVMLMIVLSAWVAFADDDPADEQESSPSQDVVNDVSENSSPQSTVTEAAESAPALETPESAPAQEEQAQSGYGSAEAPAAEVPDAACDETVTEGSINAGQAESEQEEMSSGPAEESSGPAAATLRKSPASQGPETPGAAADKTITIAGTTLNGSSDGSGDGWSYDGSSNTIVLDGLNEKADIKTNGTNVTIVTTGISRIGRLSFDGQIDIVGTGIVLIDNIEISEYSALNLRSVAEFYGEDGGSAAVFLLQKDGSYKLINGDVTGVIDDEIILPEGTMLVMPENSSLRITELFVGINYDKDNDPIYSFMEVGSDAWNKAGKFKDSALFKGHLVVDNLVLEKGSLITQITDGLEVVKSLVNDGTIRGDKGRLTVEIDGDYSGSGVLENSFIRIHKGQDLSIKIKNSFLDLKDSCRIENLINTGNSDLLYYEDTAVKNIKMSNGDQLGIYGRLGIRSKKLKLTGSVDSGELFLRSGVIDLEERFKLLNGAKISSYDSEKSKGAVVVFDYSGTGTVSLGTNGPVFMGPKDMKTVPDQKEIPVVSINIFEYIYFDGSEFVGYMDSYESRDYNILDPFNAVDAEENGYISYDALNEKYGSENGLDNIFQVFRYKDGRLSVTILHPDEKIPADNIILIRRASYLWNHQPLPGSVITTTLSSRTGSGTIGGNANRILSRNGLISITDDPVKNVTQTKTKITGNTAAAVGSGPTRVSKAYGSAIRLVVDMYDLNEGKENTEEALYYVLSAFENGAAVSELGAPAEVIMDYELPEKFRDKKLYAVFAEEDETSEEMLRAYSAEYNEETGQLSFETEQLGEFVITALDFEGGEFSPEFYDKLEKTEEIQTLIRMLEEKNE